MPRKGKELEKLVALLEKNLDENEVDIKSPEYIKGKISGENREVDVSLRGKMASADVLIIFECRDRKGSEGLNWIEELSSKGKDVGANKIIAVSSKGFARGAKKMAESFNIELRTLKNINFKEISSWIECKDLTCYNRIFEIIRTRIQLDDKKDKINLTPSDEFKFTKPVNLHTQIFLRKTDGTKASLVDVWASASQEELFADVPIDGTKVQKPVRLNFPNEDDRFQLDISPPIDIKRFDLLVILSIKISKQPAKAKIYKTKSKTLSEIVEFDFTNFGKDMNLILQRDPATGKTFFTVKEKDKK